MVNNDSQNSPFPRGKRIQDLPDPLVNQKSRKQRRPCESKDVNRESNFAGRSHLETIRARAESASTGRRFACLAPMDSAIRIPLCYAPDRHKDRLTILGKNDRGCGCRLPRCIGLPKTTHKASQIIPNKTAASTSVRKCAPNAIRLKPTTATIDIALTIDSTRQCRALRAGRIKSRSCP